MSRGDRNYYKNKTHTYTNLRHFFNLNFIITDSYEITFGIGVSLLKRENLINGDVVY